MARSSLHSSLMGFTSDCEGKFCFDYYLQPILGFAGFALADPDPALETRLAARTVRFPIIGAY